MKNLNLSELFYINPDSPSGLSWNVDRRMGKGSGYVYAKKGSNVGCYDGSYYSVIVSGKKYKVHRLIYQMVNGDLEENDVVDHIDQNRVNNHPSNLRKVTPAVNSRNKKRQYNNSSGRSGIHYDLKKSTTYAVVTWYELDGSKKTKSFSSNKLGIIECFSEAVKFREQKIKELNSLNAGYSVNHGR